MFVKVNETRIIKEDIKRYFPIEGDRGQNEPYYGISFHDNDRPFNITFDSKEKRDENLKYLGENIELIKLSLSECFGYISNFDSFG